MKGKLYEFPCLCFGLVPAPLLFTKVLKYVCNNSNTEILNFPFTRLRICDEFKETSVDSRKRSRFLGLMVNSLQMTLLTDTSYNRKTFWMFKTGVCTSLVFLRQGLTKL